MDGLRWWQRGIVYQVYPRSFQDSSGDGVGDLAGIAERLDHIAWLGADAVWLSPIYPSPMADFGYDVSDYTGIHPLFGTMADFDLLAEAIHSRGLKLILDFVPNHTSSEHPWFLEARASRENPRRDWYYFRDPKPDGSPPNNWNSNFGGPAWTFDQATGQYYHHAFLPEQPDLNWRNPEVVAAMHDALRFWLARGVDGFRVDVIWQLMKDRAFTDNPPNPDWREGGRDINRLLPLHSADLPEIHDTIAAMRRVVDEFDDRVLIGEIYLPIERLVAYYGTDGGGAHLPFNFHLILSDWDATAIASLIGQYEAALPAYGWPNWVLGNHDQPRIASRLGPAQARVAAMLLLTLRGTPTLYYADEIGLPSVAVPPERAQDPWENNEPGNGRDPARTPMQWDGSPNAGFCPPGVEPWLPLSADAATRNVQALSGEQRSILTLYRTLIAIRRTSRPLIEGSWRLLEASGSLLAYERVAGDERIVVALNLGADPVTFAPAGIDRAAAVSTHLDGGGTVTLPMTLRADEGVLLTPLASVETNAARTV